jgi:formylglycine-generating enzyme required for sulfatase activity
VRAGIGRRRALQTPRPPLAWLAPHTFRVETAQLLWVGNGWEVQRQPLLRISAGAFAMESPTGEPERSEKEGPQHRVRLAGFWLGQAPVTQAQWWVVARWQPLPADRWGRELGP